MFRSAVALAALVVLALAACESGTATPERRAAAAPSTPAAPAAPATAANATSGKDAYMKLCSQCHAKDAKGGAADHAPSLVSTTFLESATDDFLRRSIRLGRPGTSMGAYGKAVGGPLDDPSIDAIVAWLRTLGPAAKTMTAGAKGDPAAGEKLYTEYCKACHGDRGTRGEAPHLANQQFLQMATDSFIRYAIEKGRPQTKMVGFGNVMTPQQLDDVTAYVRSMGGTAPPITLLPPPTGKEPLVLNPKGGDPQWGTPRADPCPPGTSTCTNKPRYVGVDDVAKQLAAGKKMIIIDARPESEWRAVHITGAVSIPYHEPARLDPLPKDVVVIAYCACPHHLSGVVVDELWKRGHDKAYVLDEGINVWRQKGYPVVAAEGLPMPPKEATNPVPSR